MDMQSVDSGNLDQVGYDAETQTLVVLFKNGGKYQYEAVPEQVYQSLMGAPSKGQFFKDNLRYGYNYQKVG